MALTFGKIWDLSVLFGPDLGMAIEGLAVRVHESLELASVDISYHQYQSEELLVCLVFAQEPGLAEWSCVAFRNHPSPLCKQCGSPLQ